MSDTAGYVLVGGKSSRFGRDKALVEFEGQPLVLRVGEVVRSAAGSLTLIGSPEKYQHLGPRVIADSVDKAGPLAGLLAALEDSSCAWNLVTACDMPYLTTGFLRFLLDSARDANADILLPIDGEGRAEPLCAVYSLRCEPQIRSAVGRGVRKVTEAFEGLRVRELLQSEYARFDTDGRLFANMNTPADLKRAW